MSGYCILATSLSTTREKVAWLAAALGLAAAAVFAVLWLRRPVPPAPPALRLTLLPVEGGAVDAFSLSPDGRRLAFPFTREGRTLVWIRELREETAKPVEGTEDASPEEAPVWSPDSRELLFFARGRLCRVAISGGTPVVLTEAAEVNGAAWSADGTILYTPTARGGLCRVPGVKVREPRTGEEELGLRRPQFLPDGRHFIYVAVKRPAEASVVYLASLDDGSTRPLMTSSSQVQYVPGWMLFVRDERLFARPFDEARLAFTGDAVLVASPVGDVPACHRAQFSASRDGLLAFSASELRENELVWTDRSGRRLSVCGTPGHYSSVDISPDGRRVLVSNREGRTSDVWVLDAATGTATRLSEGNGVESNRLPVWGPDGTSVAWANTQADGRQNITVKRPGRALELVWPERGGFPYPLAWSGGDLLLYFDSLPKAVRSGVWRMPIESRTPVPTIEPAQRVETAALSPDGQCLAAAGGGLFLVSAKGLTQVTGAPAAFPRWRRDGKELYFWSTGTSELMVVPVIGCKAGEPQALFPVRLNRSVLSRPFDVSPDGTQFLHIEPVAVAGGTSMTVGVNWTGLIHR